MPPNGRALAACVALLCLLAQGCGEQGDAVVDPLVGASEFQRELLEDGLLTDSEYERAGLGLVECLRAGGVVVANPEFGAQGFSFSTRDPLPSGQAEFDRVFDACYEEYFSLVEFAWADQTAPSEEEEATFYRYVAECLGDNGVLVDPTDPSSLATANDEDPALYLDCLRQANAIVTGG